MIRIFLGNLGSGKSVSAVREMALDPTDRRTYTNIRTRGILKVHFVRPEEVISKGKDEDGKTAYDLNTAFWSAQKKPLNILWDEIHLTANSRNSSSKVNMVMSRFIAMARRITGFDKRGYGKFTFIAQKERTIDVNIRELANEVIYHIGHWRQYCEECSWSVMRSSEMPFLDRCLLCGSWRIEKREQYVERLFFDAYDKYIAWSYDKERKYFKREITQDIENFFQHYDTLQIEDIWNKHIQS